MATQIVQAVDRALRILHVLAASDTLLPLSSVAQQVDIPSSTTHRLLASLREQGFVRYDAETRNYGIGLAVLPLAKAARAHTTIYHEAEPLLQELAAATHETATLVLLNGHAGTYALMAKPERSMTLTVAMGEVVPMHATASGKAMLAHFFETELERFLNRTLEAFTTNTITNPLRLKEELAQIRSQGYAVDNEEREIGMRCIGSPVFDHLGNIVAAIGISGPSSRITTDPGGHLVHHTVATARALGARLGYSNGNLSAVDGSRAHRRLR